MSKGLDSSPGNLQHFLSLLSRLHKTLSMTLRPRQWLYFCHIATLQTNQTLISTTISCCIMLDLWVVPRPLSALTFLQHVLGPVDRRENNCTNHSFGWRLIDPTREKLCCSKALSGKLHSFLDQHTERGLGDHFRDRKRKQTWGA